MPKRKIVSLYGVNIFLGARLNALVSNAENTTSFILSIFFSTLHYTVSSTRARKFLRCRAAIFFYILRCLSNWSAWIVSIYSLLSGQLVHPYGKVHLGILKVPKSARYFTISRNRLFTAQHLSTKYFLWMCWCWCWKISSRAYQNCCCWTCWNHN